jgi:hypothetical protein
LLDVELTLSVAGDLRDSVREEDGGRQRRRRDEQRMPQEGPET